MKKIFHLSSDPKNKFGINQVLYSLKNHLRFFFKINKNQSIVDFIKKDYSIIHLHGCWRIRLFIFFLIGKIKKNKVFISPHGMLDPGSLQSKKFLKLILWHIYQKYIFKYSNNIIVNSKIEKENVKKLVKHKNIRLIPHGIDIPKKNNFKKKSGNLKFVFFSRIHPIKNLEKLILIWKNNHRLKRYTLSIYGDTNDEKYLQKILLMIKKEKNIIFRGKLTSLKQKILSKYDVFLFPSKTENFGLVVLEAMISGLFVVFNKNLPWQNLCKEKFGLSFDFNKKNIFKIIKTIEKNKKKIRSSKHRNKLLKYLKNFYSWNKISYEYCKVYKTD